MEANFGGGLLLPTARARANTHRCKASIPVPYHGWWAISRGCSAGRVGRVHWQSLIRKHRVFPLKPIGFPERTETAQFIKNKHPSSLGGHWLMFVATASRAETQGGRGTYISRQLGDGASCLTGSRPVGKLRQWPSARKPHRRVPLALGLRHGYLVRGRDGGTETWPAQPLTGGNLCGISRERIVVVMFASQYRGLTSCLSCCSGYQRSCNWGYVVGAVTPAARMSRHEKEPASLSRWESKDQWMQGRPVADPIRDVLASEYIHVRNRGQVTSWGGFRAGAAVAGIVSIACR